MSKLCVFAGTSEGRRLVEQLAGRGAELTACVATEYGGGYPADMFTTAFVGNRQTREIDGRMVTPRGYRDV